MNKRFAIISMILASLMGAIFAYEFWRSSFIDAQGRSTLAMRSAFVEIGRGLQGCSRDERLHDSVALAWSRNKNLMLMRGRDGWGRDLLVGLRNERELVVGTLGRDGQWGGDAEDRDLFSSAVLVEDDGTMAFLREDWYIDRTSVDGAHQEVADWVGP